MSAFAELKERAVARFLDDEPLLSPVDREPIPKALFLCLLSEAADYHRITINMLRQRYGIGVIFIPAGGAVVINTLMDEIVRDRPELAEASHVALERSRVLSAINVWLCQLFESDAAPELL